MGGGGCGGWGLARLWRKVAKRRAAGPGRYDCRGLFSARISPRRPMRGDVERFGDPGGGDARRRRATQRAHPLMRKRGAQKPTTQMRRMGAKDPTAIPQRAPMEAE